MKDRTKVINRIMNFLHLVSLNFVVFWKDEEWKFPSKISIVNNLDKSKNKTHLVKKKQPNILKSFKDNNSK